MPELLLKNKNGIKETVISSGKYEVITKNTKKYSVISDKVIATGLARFFANKNGNTYVFNSLTSLDSFNLQDFLKENVLRARFENYIKEHNFKYTNEIYFHKSRCEIVDDVIYPIRNFFDVNLTTVGSEAALVSGGFFLLQKDEVDSQYSWFGDPFGLLVSNFKVYSFATFKRSCIIQDEDNNCFVNSLCCEDLDYGYDDIWHTPKFVYSRKNTLNKKYLYCEKGFIYYILLNGYVIEKKTSGKIECPVSGIVIRFAFRGAPEWDVGLEIEIRLRKNKKKIKFAIQCAPTLVNNNKMVLNNGLFYKENLYTHNKGECLIPRIYPEGYMNGCNRPKAGIGFTRDKKLIWCALEPDDSTNISLYDVAKVMIEHEVVDAIAIDGGGSVRAYHNFKEIVGASDKRRNLPYYIELG